ncbi:MAG: TRAP transporter small permease [Spirochaetales bacterium]|jgi:TRAP-type C4-dicarboxylate transport system permease small subunit|nr:TRAP transporter small permease [Spirochaetales bacterium]
MKLFDKINKFEEGFIMACFAIMGIVLTLQIFMRYVMNMPLIWSEELARYLFVWATFIGAGYGVRNKIHIFVEIFYARMPRALKFIITLTTNTLCILVFAYLIPYGISTVKTQWYIGSSAMEIPMSFVFAAIPLGCFIVCLRLLGDIVRAIKTKGENL